MKQNTRKIIFHINKAFELGGKRMNVEGENKMPLCKFCDEDHLELRHETRKVVIKGIEVEYEHELYYCPELEEEFEEGDLIDKNLNIARNAYRKKVGLLTSEEIKDIRDRFSLSQKDLAVLLNMGEISITRIETKVIQDKTTDDTIRRIEEDPVFLLDKLEINKEKLGKKYNTIKAKIDFNEEASKYNEKIIKVYYSGFMKEPDTTGNMELSFEKIGNMIAYFLLKCKRVYKTKLNKLLWYVDFYNCKMTGKSISGLAYRHLPFGAVPVAIDEILKSLSYIHVEEKESPDYDSTYFEITTNKEFDSSYFTEEEMICLEKISKEFETIGGKEISDKMHQEKAYLETRDREFIYYKFSEYLNIN